MNTSFSLNYLLGFVSAFFLVATSGLGAWEKGDSLPSFSAYELEGDIPAFEGKVTYVDFWASWCPPCKAAFPEIERLYLENKDAGFQVVAVSVDSTDKAMRKFLERAQPSFAVARDGNQSLVAAAGVEVMPTSFLVDGNGVIRSVHYGWRGEETAKQLESEIKDLLLEAKE